MGLVYKGIRAGEAVPVAIKTVIRFHRKMLASLRAEVLALLRIQHPGVVRIIAEGLSEEQPWYSMELLEGKTLAQVHDDFWPDRGTRNRSTPTPIDPDACDDPILDLHPAESPTRERSPSATPLILSPEGLRDVLTLYRRLCAPLAFIHAEGIVHRDIKPSNVIVRLDGTPVIMDFGLASRALGAGGRESLEFNGRFFGSLPYVAPEQIRDEFVDARADLYALGCMMYEHITGQPPFSGTAPRLTIDRHLWEEPQPPSALCEGIPPAVDRLLLALLAKRPQDRVGHAADLAAELAKLGASDGDTDGAAGGEPSSPTRVASLYRPELVGRKEVLDDLNRACQRAIARHGSLIFIAGESGIGKTYLAAEVARQAAQQGLQVITGACASLGTDARGAEAAARPLHPFRRMFEILLDRCREGGPATTEMLFHGTAKLFGSYEPSLRSLPGADDKPEPPSLPPEAARHRLFAALANILSALSSDNPTLVILDDLQWADELSLSFLASLPEDFFEGKALVLVCVYRSDEVPFTFTKLTDRGGAQLHRLERLGPAAITSMVRDMLSVTDPPAQLVRFVSERSEGNPFFVAEYLRLAAAEGVIHRRHGAWTMPGTIPGDRLLEELPVPTSIQELVTQRLFRLPSRERIVLEVAAVLGRDIEFDLVGEVSGLGASELAVVMRELVARQLLEETADGHQRFVHHKTREVAYAQIPDARRAEWHQAAGRALEGRAERDQVLGTLAYHFQRAGDRASATKYLEEAGFQALSRFANHEAERAFRSLLEWGEGGGEGGDGGADNDARLRRGRWERGLGDALHGLGRMEESREHLLTATRLFGCPSPGTGTRMTMALLGELTRQLRWIFVRTSPATGEGSVQQASLEGSRAYDRLLQIAYYTGKTGDMFYATFRTLNLAERAGPSPELAMAYSIAHAVAGIIPLRRVADFYLARADQALSRAYDPAVDSYLQLLAGVYRSGTAEWAKARHAFDKGIVLAEQMGFGRRNDELRLGLANWHFQRGEYAEGARQTEAHHGGPSGRGDLQAEAWQRLMRAQIDLVQGAFAEALDVARTVEKFAGSLQRSELIWVYALIAAAAERLGRRDQARTAADNALDQITSGPPVTFYCIESYALTAEVYLRLWSSAGKGEATAGALPSRARKACEALTKFARVFPAARPRAALHAGTLALLRGDSQRAMSRWLESHQLAERLGMTPDRMMADWAIGRQQRGSLEGRQRLLTALETATLLRAWRAVDGIKEDGATVGYDFGVSHPHPNPTTENQA
jgi:tetratricopeptide (TPR) repeat protein